MAPQFLKFCFQFFPQPSRNLVPAHCWREACTQQCICGVAAHGSNAHAITTKNVHNFNADTARACCFTKLQGREFGTRAPSTQRKKIMATKIGPSKPKCFFNTFLVEEIISSLFLCAPPIGSSIISSIIRILKSSFDVNFIAFAASNDLV